jgi:hypothetical protein
MIIIGVDPGGTTGLAVLTLVDGRYQCPHVEQIPAGGFPARYAAVVLELLSTGKLVDGLLVATEAFVVRGRAAKSRTPHGGEHARRVNGYLDGLASVSAPAMVLQVRSASQVKKWTTDRRLAAAGILEQTRGMGHARDAQRHALFAARMDLQWPDPLSVTYPKDKISS